MEATYVMCGLVTGFGSQSSEARKIFISLKNEFKDGHKGDLSRFMNTKQSKRVLYTEGEAVSKRVLW
jgi:hypothetical protein